MRRGLGKGVLPAACLSFLALTLPADAGAAKLAAATYPGITTTYSCRTDPIPIHPGQNLSLFATTKTCPMRSG